MKIMHIMASKARWSTTSLKSCAGERARTFVGAWKVALVCDEFSGYKAEFAAALPKGVHGARQVHGKRPGNTS